MDICKLLRSGRVIVWDGGFGTSLAKRCHCEPVNSLDRRAPKGACNEELNLIAPDIVQAVHEDFILAGSQVIETNTFGANRIALAEHGLADKVREINLAAVRIAKSPLVARCPPLVKPKESRAASNERRFVSGSIGPTSKLPTLGHISFNEMVEAYHEQASALIEGGVDILQIETCQDILQAKAAVVGCKTAMSSPRKQCHPRGCKRGPREHTRDPRVRGNDNDIPIIVTITLERSGTTLLGTEIGAALATLAPLGITAFGLNCGTGPAEMEEAISFLSKNSPLPVIVQPNAGLPEIKDGVAHYNLGPAEFAEWIGYFVKNFGVRMVGGCCGTTAEHIRAIRNVIPAKLVPACSKQGAGIQRISRDPRFRGDDMLRGNDMLSSLYSPVSLDQSPPPLIIGERMNINGSKEFREHILSGNFDGAAEMARRQAERGAHVLDLSVAYAGRDEVKDMHEMAKRLATQSPLPIMIDSTNPDAIEAALSRLGGRSIINSINLEDGGTKARKIVELAKRHGAALVALTIDEEGMALTAKKKIAVAKRLIEFCRDAGGGGAPPLQRRRAGGLPLLLIDLLTFTLADPKAAEAGSGRETLKAIEQVAKLTSSQVNKSSKRSNLRTCELANLRTILGVSNISYGFKPEARKVLNSIFLYEAVKAGLNAAIVHAGQILPLHKIDKEAAKLALDLIHCKKSDALKRFTQHFERVIPAKLVPACSKQGAGIQRISRDSRFRGNDHESILTNHIIDGNKTGLEETIGNVLKKLQAEEIINKVLLPAMQVVGERFGSNELPLPFVLQSAETMRTAVDILKPYLKAGESACRGTIVLATVRGDVHDIGKNLVDIILSNNGYKVINLGVKQPAHEVIESALKHKADAIGLSGLIVQSCMVMKEELAEMAHRKLNIPVICGGAALTKKFVENDLQKAYDGKVYYERDAFDGLKIMDIIASKAEQSREPTGPPRP